MSGKGIATVPELPEVETTMRALASKLQGKSIIRLVQRRPDLRFPLPKDLPNKLESQRFVRMSRRAKYILIDLSNKKTLILHLGMSGRLLLDAGDNLPHAHLVFHFDNGRYLAFVDPRRFGMLDLWPSDRLAEHKWLNHLGLEPLSGQFDGNALLGMLAGRLTPLKSALLDQQRVVGIGNIYACESLFRARLSPLRQAMTVGPKQAVRLASSIQNVLNDAIEAGGSSLRDYTQSNGELGNFQSMFQVYGREGQPCLICGSLIEKIVQSGRSTFWCKRCQR